MSAQLARRRAPPRLSGPLGAYNLMRKALDPRDFISLLSQSENATTINHFHMLCACVLELVVIGQQSIEPYQLGDESTGITAC